jgi:hypothetical protein
MASHELTEFDSSDAIFNTMWRQDQLMLPVMDQLGVSSS